MSPNEYKEKFRSIQSPVNSQPSEGNSNSRRGKYFVKEEGNRSSWPPSTSTGCVLLCWLSFCSWGGKAQRSLKPLQFCGSSDPDCYTYSTSKWLQEQLWEWHKAEQQICVSVCKAIFPSSMFGVPFTHVLQQVSTKGTIYGSSHHVSRCWDHQKKS